MSVILAWVGLSALVLGVIGLARPLPKLKISDRKRAGLAVLFGVVMMVAAVGIAPKPDNSAETSTESVATAAAAPAAHPKAAMPPDQIAFIQAVLSSRKAYRQAPNELAKGGTRARRRLKICRALRSVMVQGWLGRIVKLESNTDGEGVLAVEIAHNVTLSTWNNALSDLAHHTLIDPGSALFAVLAKLKKGQEVRFSGRFFPDDIDCVAEQSLTLSGSMRAPEFVFRFSQVQPR